MKALLLVFLGFLMVPTAQAATGFSNGNNIEITEYSGWVRVINCPNSFNNSYYCSAADYNPGAFDRFTIDQRVKADGVELTAFHADGSKRTKKEKFDANKGLSRRFNLLISTLFQRPLLEDGVNRVSYSLTKKKREVASGEFEANVNYAGSLRCPDLTISGWSISCDNASAACSEYFNRISGCQ